MKKVISESDLEEAIVREMLELDPDDDSSVHLFTTVKTPVGPEIADPLWCEEPTRIMSAAQAEVLIRRCVEAPPSQRPTAPPLRFKKPTSFIRRVDDMDDDEDTGQWKTGGK